MTTPHTCGGPVFGRKTPGCPRCDDLAAGARPTAGWGSHKKAVQASFARALAAHCCKTAGCLPICTFGDW